MGATRWYFPKAASGWLALPAAIVGLYLAAVINRYGPDEPRRGLRGRSSPLVMYVFMPLMLGLFFAIGAPALWLRLEGPEREIMMTVAELGTGAKSCRHRASLYGSAIDIPRFCVTAEEFDRLHKGQKVMLEIRDGPFGLLAFSIRAADQGPE